MNSYICKSAKRISGQYGPFIAVETETGEKFNMDIGIEQANALEPGIEFYAEFYTNKKGNLSISKDKETGEAKFAVNVSTPRPRGEMEQVSGERVTDGERQQSIEAQNALTNLTTLVCHYPLWDDTERAQLANELVEYGKKKMGLNRG